MSNSTNCSSCRRVDCGCGLGRLLNLHGDSIAKGDAVIYTTVARDSNAPGYETFIHQIHKPLDYIVEVYHRDEFVMTVGPFAGVNRDAIMARVVEQLESRSTVTSGLDGKDVVE